MVGSIARDFEGARRGKVRAPKAPQPSGSLGACSPQVMFKFGVSEIPSLAFSAGHFLLNKDEGKYINSRLFYPSLVLSVKYRLVTAKKGKTVTPSRTLQVKGEMCIFQTGRLCYNAININYVLLLVYVQNCKGVQSLVCHGPL